MSKESIKYIVSCIKPFKHWVLLQFFIGVIWAIDLSLRPFIAKIMIDKLEGLDPQEAVNALALPALIYVGMALLMVFILRLYDYIWLIINPGLKRHLGDSLMNRMMLHSPSLLQNHFSGGLGNRIKDVMSGVPDLVRLLINHFFSNLLALLIAVITFWTVNYKFATVLSIWIVVFLTVALFMSKKARYLSQVSAEIKTSVVGYIVDILSNIINVKLFSNNKYEAKYLKNYLNDYVAADRKRDWYFLVVFAIQGVSFVVYQAVCIIWLILGFKNGNISAGDFALILSVNMAIINCLWNLSENIGKFAEITGNISQGLSVVLSPLMIKDKEGVNKLKVTKGEIIFDNVEFHYKGTKNLFENKSITIPAGQKVGLVGHSGSGKSTFVNLILRLFDIQNGEIIIDGQNIRKVTQNSLRKAIAMIPQEPSLFHRSLLENIRYGNVNASDLEVIEAAKKARAHDFIVKMPQGYNILVGERGMKLSGGQRQRIAIARAFLKNAPILILDEATSQLDSITENDIQESLDILMENKTTIIVAHRLSTLLNMDRILVFKDGEIVEDGSHKELLSKDSVYKNLWDAQVGGFLPD